MFAEDSTLFMDGADATVVCGAQTCKAWFDMPGQDALGGRVLSSEYQITYPAGALALSSGVAITVNGAAYKVRRDAAIDDGVFRQAVLERVAP